MKAALWTQNKHCGSSSSLRENGLRLLRKLKNENIKFCKPAENPVAGPNSILSKLIKGFSRNHIMHREHLCECVW